ncbi:hypothetical protein [Rosettibacter firmus]|uniref:hypothetical protein n=1 Tax=Rosettibacter firmus TaxID=3111522 RepID=UPI00336BB96F
MKKMFITYFAKKQDKLKKYVSLFKETHPEIKQNIYPEKLIILFEKYLEVYAHAYCMDVKKERKKTARICITFYVN